MARGSWGFFARGAIIMSSGVKMSHLAAASFSACTGQTGSWLEVRDGLYGCKVCASADNHNSLSLFSSFEVKHAKVSNLKRHGKSPEHLRNEMLCFGCQPAVDARASPSVLDFSVLWEHRRSGGSLDTVIEGLTNATPGTCASPKLSQMLWRIAEARRLRFRQFLRQAASVTLMQDGRGKHVLIRATASNSKLQTMTGTIGIVESHGGATNLSLATLDALTTFCTPYWGKPSAASDSGCQPKPDVDFLRHLGSIVTWWYTDAAYDEYAAGEMLRLPASSGGKLFTNLKVIGREKAHASRRVLERPQRADPYLADVGDKFL